LRTLTAQRGGRARQRRGGTEAAYIERINLAIDHILADLSRPARLRGLARAARMSPYHFHRVFQAVVGETPADFAKRVRLERALLLMAHGKGRSLTDIAFGCGFASSSDFSRSFKQRYGVPPRKCDLRAWMGARGAELERNAGAWPRPVVRLAPRASEDGFTVRVRELPARTVAYIRVDKPYQGRGVVNAVERLMRWADERGWGDGQWLGYQWENPEITPLEQCRYHVAVEIPAGRQGSFDARGEVGRYRFPPMLVAQVDMDGGIDLELRALRWLYGAWLARSGYVPDDQPGFEAWVGRPFADGMERFRIGLQLPVRRT
jgi:AraC family transcriptional regulator